MITTGSPKERPAAVHVTLSCAWCARAIYDVEGQMLVNSGHLAVREDADRFHLASGRPRCRECGGPLLVDDWRLSPPARRNGGPSRDEQKPEERAAA